MSLVVSGSRAPADVFWFAGPLVHVILPEVPWDHFRNPWWLPPPNRGFVWSGPVVCFERIVISFLANFLGYFPKSDVGAARDLLRCQWQILSAPGPKYLKVSRVWNPSAPHMCRSAMHRAYGRLRLKWGTESSHWFYPWSPYQPTPSFSSQCNICRIWLSWFVGPKTEAGGAVKFSFITPTIFCSCHQTY